MILASVQGDQRLVHRNLNRRVLNQTRGISAFLRKPETSSLPRTWSMGPARSDLRPVSGRSAEWDLSANRFARSFYIYKQAHNRFAIQGTTFTTFQTRRTEWRRCNSACRRRHIHVHQVTHVEGIGSQPCRRQLIPNRNANSLASSEQQAYPSPRAVRHSCNVVRTGSGNRGAMRRTCLSSTKSCYPLHRSPGAGNTPHPGLERDPLHSQTRRRVQYCRVRDRHRT